MNGDDGRRTVLVVDDEPDLCEIVRRTLDGHGFTVLTAGGVTEARTRCDTYPGEIDLLITDVRMPDGTGPDLAAEARCRRPGMTVLYVSGLPGHTPALAQLADADGKVLAKPFAPSDLVRAVRQAMPAA